MQDLREEPRTDSVVYIRSSDSLINFRRGLWAIACLTNLVTDFLVNEILKISPGYGSSRLVNKNLKVSYKVLRFQNLRFIKDSIVEFDNRKK